MRGGLGNNVAFSVLRASGSYFRFHGGECKFSSLDPAKHGNLKVNQRVSPARVREYSEYENTQRVTLEAVARSKIEVVVQRLQRGQTKRQEGRTRLSGKVANGVCICLGESERSSVFGGEIRNSRRTRFV